MYWKCICSCEKNTVREVSAYDLTSGKSRSCGCIRDELNIIFVKNHTKHNMHKTKIYRVWYHLKGRCLNPYDKAYKNYGGRGIAVCNEWLDKENGFINFYNDMNDDFEKHMKIFGERNTTLDRIDTNGNYSKENCRWATIQEQNRNKRMVTKITIEGITYSIPEIAKKINISKYIIYKLVNKVKSEGNIDNLENEIIKMLFRTNT